MEGITINLEAGHPTVEKAFERLSAELRRASAMGAKYAKLIHGYGSSGAGGQIKKALPKKLMELKRSARIKAYVAGEDFSPFNPTARDMVSKAPALGRDPDYSACNHGITVVLL